MPQLFAMAPAHNNNSKPQTKLLRILGAGFGLAAVVGGTVGVGILHLPGTVAAELGNFWLILAVWVIGGLYALFGAISVTELAAMLPQAGGFYVYAKRAFGNLAGFLVGWGDWLNNCSALAYASYAAAEYLKALAPTVPGSPRIIAIALLAFFAALHWTGLRVGSLAQEITSSATAITLVVLALACFFYRAPAHALSSENITVVPALFRSNLGVASLLAAFVIALRSVIVTYDGWYEPIYFAEEDTNPARHLPRVLIGGVFLVIGLYLTLNLAFLRVLPIPVLAASKLPAADAAQMVFASWSGKFVTFVSLLTLLSFLNCVLLGTTRILFAIGRDGLFTESASRVSASGTPRPAMLISVGVSLMLVVLETFEKIIAIAAVLFVVVYCVTYTAVFVLRWRAPSLARPFRAWGYPWTTAIVLLGSLLFLAGAAVSDPRSMVYGVLLLAASVPVYFWKKRSRAEAPASS